MNLPLKTIVFYFYLLYTVIVLGACVGLNNAVLRCNGTEHLHLSFFFFSPSMPLLIFSYH